jgi:hypothetical protein
MGTIRLYDHIKKEYYTVRTRKKPKGYATFTDTSKEEKEYYEKQGYKTKIGLIPYLNSRYDNPNKKVLYISDVKAKIPLRSKVRRKLRARRVRTAVPRATGGIGSSDWIAKETGAFG